MLLLLNIAKCRFARPLFTFFLYLCTYQTKKPMENMKYGNLNCFKKIYC